MCAAKLQKSGCGTCRTVAVCGKAARVTVVAAAPAASAAAPEQRESASSPGPGRPLLDTGTTLGEIVTCNFFTAHRNMYMIHKPTFIQSNDRHREIIIRVSGVSKVAV